MIAGVISLIQENMDIAPIEKIAIMILNQATEIKAQAVLLDRNGSAENIILKFKIAGHWRRFEQPPKFLWTNLRNVYLLWAGIDYWKRGEFSGTIKQDSILQEWSLKISELQDVIEFKPVT